PPVRCGPGGSGADRSGAPARSIGRKYPFRNGTSDATRSCTDHRCPDSSRVHRRGTMFATRSRRLALISAVLGLALVLPSAAFAGASWKTLDGTLVAAHGDSLGASAAGSKSIWYDK